MAACEAAAGGPEPRRLQRAAQGDESNLMHPCLYITQNISNSAIIFTLLQPGATHEFCRNFGRVSREFCAHSPPVLAEFPPSSGAPRPRVPTSDYHALQRVPPALEPNCQPCETVCAQRQLMETGSAPCVSLSLHAAHTRSFPNVTRTTMHSHSRCAPITSLRQAPPYSVAASHTRARSTASSHSRTCRLAPTARVRHYSQVASEPGRRTTTCSHSRSCRLPRYLLYG